MQIYNTLSSQKEEFTPQSNTIKMYVCGVTPYDSCHLGHAMSFIIFDTIRRYLEFRGYTVNYIQNFTDIDDKIINRANERGIPAQELAEGFINQYYADMDALNIRRADVYPKATEEIPKIIEVVEGLIHKGYAYEVEGSVYFRVNKDEDYGKLSHRNLNDMIAGARVEVEEAKEYPLDFTLWKATKPGEPQWESPWGMGRPGWHIECSAMSLKYLGETLDIHGGGQDLIFPHHENEIAQSESFTGITPFVHIWIHNGLMQLGEDKMSKSLGNLVTINEALEKYSADAIRLWVVNSHYRSPLVYSDETLDAAEKGVERLKRTLQLESKETAKISINTKAYKEKFIEAMDDDFGTPQATAILFDLVRDINRAHDAKRNIGEAQQVLLYLSQVLGLTLKEKETLELPIQSLLELFEKYVININGPSNDETQRGIQCIELLINKRAEARKSREFQIADGIRNDLTELGITLEDTPQRTTWKYKKS